MTSSSTAKPMPIDLVFILQRLAAMEREADPARRVAK
jgi:hypothetical protein